MAHLFRTYLNFNLKNRLYSKLRNSYTHTWVKVFAVSETDSDWSSLEV